MTVETSIKDSNSLKLAVKQSLVEKFAEGSERPCENTDFVESRKIREKLTTDIRIFIENLVKDYFAQRNEESKTTDNYRDMEKELLVYLLILYGQNVTLHPWNSETIVNTCKIILHEILKVFNCKDASEMVSKKLKINLTKDILQILCNDLTSSQWKHFPASVACYKWILEMIKQPELSQYMPLVLPPALLLTDDFVNENRIVGAQCLNHIVENITIAELQLCSYGDVIFNALLPILRIREADLIQAVILPLVTLTTKLEFNLGKEDLTKWSKFDDILEIFLENMELEQVIDLRNCYINSLSLLITAIGCGIIRWSKRLLRIFDEYIQTAGKYNDEKTMNQCLKVIGKFIEFSHEVTPIHAQNLFFTLLIALHSTSSSNSELQRENRELTVKCIKIVMESIKETEKEKIKKDLREKLVPKENLNKFHEEILNLFSENK